MSHFLYCDFFFSPQQIVTSKESGFPYTWMFWSKKTAFCSKLILSLEITRLKHFCTNLEYSITVLKISNFEFELGVPQLPHNFRSTAVWQNFNLFVFVSSIGCWPSLIALTESQSAVNIHPITAAKPLHIVTMISHLVDSKMWERIGYLSFLIASCDW